MTPAPNPCRDSATHPLQAPRPKAPRLPPPAQPPSEVPKSSVSPAPAFSALSPALPCFLPVLGGAGGGAGPPPPSSLSGGGGAEAAMEWGTRVSGGGGRTRPRVASSPGKGVGGTTSPRAAATPSAARGRRRARLPSARSPQPHRPPSRPRPQPPEPELGSAATTETAGEGGDWPRQSEPLQGRTTARPRRGPRLTGPRRGPAPPGRRRPAASGPDRTIPGRGACLCAPRGWHRGAARDRGPLCTREPRPPGQWSRRRRPAAPSRRIAATHPQWSRAVACWSPARARPAGFRRGGPTANNRQRQELRGRRRRNMDFNFFFFPLV